MSRKLVGVSKTSTGVSRTSASEFRKSALGPHAERHNVFCELCVNNTQKLKPSTPPRPPNTSTTPTHRNPRHLNTKSGSAVSLSRSLSLFLSPSPSRCLSLALHLSLSLSLSLALIFALSLLPPHSFSLCLSLYLSLSVSLTHPAAQSDTQELSSVTSGSPNLFSEFYVRRKKSCFPDCVGLGRTKTGFSDCMLAGQMPVMRRLNEKDRHTSLFWIVCETDTYQFSRLCVGRPHSSFADGVKDCHSPVLWIVCGAVTCWFPE